jgi:Tol biopolymer transport system component
MKRIIAILILLVFYQFSFGQKIGKDEAFEIAKENGLAEGIEEPTIELNNNIWTIKCLICDEIGSYQVIKVDAITGEVKMEGRFMEMSGFVGEQSKKTEIIYSGNWDSIPRKFLKETPHRLPLNENIIEANPAISPNNKTIAFQYGFRKIGIVDTEGNNFSKIDDESLYPEWLDDEWVAYFKDFKYICKRNIKTGQEIRITENPGEYDNFQISPDNKWIAYTSSEVWYAQKKDSLEIPIVFASINGQDQDLCLLSMDGKVKKYITKINKYVHTPCWSENGDTLFFDIENSTYFASQLEDDTIKYLPMEKLNSISLTDYQRIEKGIFPFKHNCKIYAIDKNTLTPKYVLNEKPGRYGDMLFSHDLKYLIYTKQDFINSDKKLWIQKLE